MRPQVSEDQLAALAGNSTSRQTESANNDSEKIKAKYRAAMLEMPELIPEIKDKGIQHSATVRYDTSAEEKQSKLEESIATMHCKALLLASKKGYSFAIRETGAASIARIEQGAKPKPHFILEKTIKDGSIKKGYFDTFKETKEKMQHLDLEGFVGHWDKDGKLLGIRMDHCTPQHASLCLPTADGQGVYLPVDLNAANGGLSLEQLKSDAQWKTNLYTGDYDLHELHHHGKLMVEGSAEKAHALSLLNTYIAEFGNDPKRSGKFEARDHLIHMQAGQGEYAMFQHGDQATYIANQINEAKANNEDYAKLVPAVAEHDKGTNITFDKGVAYVTNSPEELQELRTAINAKSPAHWLEGKRKRSLGSGRASGYSDNGPERRTSLVNAAAAGTLSNGFAPSVLSSSSDSEHDTTTATKDATLGGRKPSSVPKAWR